MRILWLALLALLISSCNISSRLEEVHWQQGDSVEQLKFLNTIDRSLPEELAVLDEVIEYSSQTHGNIEVENSFVKKISHRDGALLSVSSRYKQPSFYISRQDLENFQITPQVKTAIKKNFTFLTEKDLETLKPLIEAQGRLVWQVEYLDKGIIPRALRISQDMRLVRDIRIGTEWFDRIAFIYPHGPKFGLIKEVPLRNISFNPLLSHPQFTILSRGSVSFDPDEKVLKYPPSDMRFDQLQVYHYVDQALIFIQRVLGVDFKMPLQIELQIGFPDKTNAAFYYNGKIRLGAGDDIIYSKIPQDPSIVSHEVFHSLVETLSHLPYEGEGGSLNEAFADFFTSQLLGRPELGDSAFLQGPYKRSLVNEKKWSERNGALYGDSLIISGLMWSLGRQIPSEKMQLVALKTLSHLNPASQFVDFNREFRRALTQHLSPSELKIALRMMSERGFPQ